MGLGKKGSELREKIVFWFHVDVGVACVREWLYFGLLTKPTVFFWSLPTAATPKPNTNNTGLTYLNAERFVPRGGRASRTTFSMPIIVMEQMLHSVW